MPVDSRRGHRVWNTQPLGGSAADGMSPVSRIRDARSPSSDGTAENSASVYGWCGPANTVSDGPTSITRPRYSTTMRSDRYLTRPRSCEMNR